jgi:hypothetical protein
MYATTLSRNVWFNITNYLNYIDCKNFSNVFPFLPIDYSIKKFISRLKFRLSEMGLNPDLVISNMIKHKVVISGSLILQILLDEKWENSDIDFYRYGTKRRNWDDYHSFLYSINPVEREDYYTDNKYKLLKPNDHYQVLPISSRKYFIKFTKGSGATVNYIIIQPNNKKNIKNCDEFIDILFDFDFCKNIFTGKKLIIKNLDSIINKQCRLNLNHYSLKVHGKNLIDLDKNCYMNMLKIKNKRVEKYRNRGFKVIDIY